MDDSFPERDMWILAGANPNIWEMVLQGSTGFSGAFGRQATLRPATARTLQTRQILDALTQAAAEGAIRLQADGVRIAADGATPLALEYVDGAFAARDGSPSNAFSRQALVSEAAAGRLILTLTGRLGTQLDHPPPALWQDVPIQQQTPAVEVPFLIDDGTLRLRGRHVQPGASVFVDGRKVGAEVRCESGVPAAMRRRDRARHAGRHSAGWRHAPAAGAKSRRPVQQRCADLQRPLRRCRLGTAT